MILPALVPTRLVRTRVAICSRRRESRRSSRPRRSKREWQLWVESCHEGCGWFFSGHTPEGRLADYQTTAEMCKSLQSGGFPVVSERLTERPPSSRLVFNGARSWTNRHLPREESRARPCAITGEASKTRTAKSSGRSSGTSTRIARTIPREISLSRRTGRRTTSFAADATERRVAKS